MEELKLTSPDFLEGEWIPIKHSGRGADLSPRFAICGIDPQAKTMAMILEDVSHPLIQNFTHWLIWNLPVQDQIPGAIPPGAAVESLSGAIQGVAYGRNRYKGPKPPLRAVHTYVYTLYVLNDRCALPPTARKRDLLTWIKGHTLQSAVLSGRFQSH